MLDLKETGQVLLGSPLIAMNAQFPFSQCFFVDRDSANIATLQQRISHKSNGPLIHYYVDDANQAVSSIVATLRAQDSLNIAFLDPTGLQIQWSTIQGLASVRRMDLLIYWPSMGINLNVKNAYESQSDTAIDRFFGTRGWRQVVEKWYQSRQGQVPHRALIDLYKQRLGTLGYQEIKTGDEVLDEPLMRATGTNAPLYRLIFASKHPLGVDFWRKITKRNVRGQGRLFD